MLQFSREKKREHRHEQSNPGKRFGYAADEHAQLPRESARFQNRISRTGLLVLATAEGVEEAVNGPGIAPLHGRVGHARERHVEVKSRAEKPQEAHNEYRSPFSEQRPGSNCQPAARNE